jgi:hypothetical protein
LESIVKYECSTYRDEYDVDTIQYYKSHRIQKTDPVTFEVLEDNKCFKYYKIWNPYTGVVLNNDPYGPLCFNPVTIVTHIYYSRLNNIWINESDGIYSGYYGDGIGAGKEQEIKHKGTYPERYIFRLPIQNCYLPRNHNLSTITLGPELTDHDISVLDVLMTEHYINDDIYRKIGSLANLKRYYDIAISKEPLNLDLNNTGINIELAQRHPNPHNYINRCAVDILRRM